MGDSIRCYPETLFDLTEETPSDPEHLILRSQVRLLGWIVVNEPTKELVAKLCVVPGVQDELVPD